MKEYVYSDIRVKFLSDDIVRLEVSSNGVFCDSDTMLVANKSAFHGEKADVKISDDGAYVTCGAVTVFIPAGAKSLVGVKATVDGKTEYVYKKLSNSGELPPMSKTPVVFALADTPRVIAPKCGYTPVNLPDNGYVIEKNVQDVYLLLCRKNGAKLRKLYVELTGRAELVRLSSLGSWNSRYYKYSQKEAERMIEDYRAHEIPLDNIVIDTDWRKRSDRGIGYDVDTDLFPDMAGYFRFAHECDVDVMFNDHPEPLEGAKNCIDPKEVAYREARLSEHLLNGLDIWWYDRNWTTKLISPVEGIAPETWGMYAFTEITKHVRQKQAGNKEIYRRPDIMANVDDIVNGRYVGISNSASHRYSVQWTGDVGSDYTDIYYALTQMLKCGDNCLPYVHPDCGGHMGDPDKNTYLRWIQFCSLGTILRPHCTNTVKRFREPWAYDDKETEDIARNYINLRYRLLPLIYTEAYKSYRDGSPICRGMLWNYPEDKKAAKKETQYMIGNNLLVAPIVEGELLCAPASYFKKPVSVTYYNGIRLEGEPIKKATYKDISMYCDNVSPEKGVPIYDYSAVWETVICPEKDCNLFVEADDGVRVFVDGTLYAEDWSTHSAKKYDIGKFEKNVEHNLRIEYFQGGDRAVLMLRYAEPVNLSSRLVYLPEGQWINLFTGKTYNGGKSIKVKTDDVSAFPLFMRSGGVMVTARNALNTKVQKWDRLTFDIFPSKTASDEGFIYEDDRNTTAYKTGQFCLTDYSLKYADNKITFVLNPVKGNIGGKYAVKTRKIRVKFHTTGDFTKISKVLINGIEKKAITRSKKRGEFPFSDSNYASDSRLLTIEFSASVKEKQTVEFLL